MHHVKYSWYQYLTGIHGIKVVQKAYSVAVATKVTQNNIGKYTKESSQRTFQNTEQQFGCMIWTGLPKSQQWNRTDQKVAQDKPQFMMVKFQNVIDSDAQDTFRPISGLLSCAVICTRDKIFWNLIDIRCNYFSNVHAFRYGCLYQYLKWFVMI